MQLFDTEVYARPVPVDLSIKALQGFDVRSRVAMEEFILQKSRESNATVLYGGYQEDRGWYVRNQSFTASGEERTIHIGVDLWISAGTAVYIPFPCSIHSFQDNQAVGDYGPTIILKPDAPVLDAAYFLIGHLSRDAIEGRAVGERLEQGSLMGHVGSPEVNGDWPSHLHVQLIRDIQNKMGDYPGVCSRQMLSYYSGNCPNPTNLLVKET